MKYLHLVLAALALLGSSAAAHADITGDTVSLNFYVTPTAGGPTYTLDNFGNFVVPSSGVATGYLPNLGLDYTLSSTSISFSEIFTLNFDAASFYGFSVVDQSEPFSVNVATLDGASTVTGTLPTAAFAGSGLYVNFAGTDFAPGESADFDFSTVVTPEPSSLMLLSTGILASAGSLRRRYRRA